MGGYEKNHHRENIRRLILSVEGKEVKKRVPNMQQSIVAGM